MKRYESSFRYIAETVSRRSTTFAKVHVSLGNGGYEWYLRGGSGSGDVIRSRLRGEDSVERWSGHRKMIKTTGNCKMGGNKTSCRSDVRKHDELGEGGGDKGKWKKSEWKVSVRSR